MWLLAAILAVTLLVGIPFLLWWWRIADTWVDVEQRRFLKSGAKRGAINQQRVIVHLHTRGPEREQAELVIQAGLVRQDGLAGAATPNIQSASSQSALPLQLIVSEKKPLGTSNAHSKTSTQAAGASQT